MENELVCSWVVQVANNPQPPAGMCDEEYSYWCEWAGEYVAENPYLFVECGAPVHDIVDGWACEAGHTHLYYGSPSQQAQERQEALFERCGWDHGWD